MVIIPNEYGRAHRTWTGKLPSRSFKRFIDEVNNIDEFIDIELNFDLDDQNRTTVEGTASVSAGVSCHRCAEIVTYPIVADINARIVHDENQAADVSTSFDVTVCGYGEVEIKTLIEDDLMLAIPWTVCPNNEHCKVGVAREYLLDEPDTVPTQKPFGSLRDLLKE